MKKISQQAYFFRKMFRVFGIGMLLVLLLTLWTLYRGPIAVPYLKPYIIQALNYDEDEYQIDVGNVHIELVRSIQPIRVTAQDIEVRKRDDSFMINAPKLYLSFSLRALLKGIIAPSDVEIKDAMLVVNAKYGVTEDNNSEVNKKKLQFYMEQFKEFLQKYNAPDRIYPESFVNNINIVNANVEFHEVELGRDWMLSDLNFEFSRNLINMEINAGAQIDINGKVASAGVESVYHANMDKMDLDIFFSDLILSDIMSTFNETTEDNMLSMLGIEVPVNGKISTSIQLADMLQHTQDAADYLGESIEYIKFEIDGDKGYISFNGEEKYNYEIDKMALTGEMTGGIDEIHIDNAAFKLGGQEATISLQASGFETYFLENSLKDFVMRWTVSVSEFPFGELSRFWPRYIAEPAWQWCKDGLIGGTAQKADFIFDFGYDRKSETWGLLQLRGTGHLNDVDLFYLEGMPLVHHVYGTAHFSEHNILIDIDKGVSDGVIVTNGKVDIYDLNKEDNFISIDLVGNSSVTDVLKLIDNPPLEFTRDMGLDPQAISGQVDVRLKLDFELRQDLQGKDVKVDVAADLHNMKTSQLIDDHLITSEKMKLKVNSKGWNLSGDAKFDNVPIQLQIDEPFAAKDYKSKCHVELVLDEAVKKELGLDWAVLNAPSLEGNIDIKADIITKKDNLIDVDVQADLQHTKLNYTYLGLIKEKGQPASGNIKLQFADKKLLSVPKFNLIKSGWVMNGKIGTYPSGRIKIIEISDISAPKTSARAKINLTDSDKPTIKVEISGNSYNLMPMFEQKEDDKQNQEPSADVVQENEDDGLEKLNNTDIFMTVGSLWTNQSTPIQNFAGSAKLRHGIGIDELHMIGNFGIDKSIKVNVDYTPRDKNEHYLAIDSNNAGSTLKVLHIYDNMVGGNLKIEARRDKDKKFIGHAAIRDFSIQNAPVMAQILSVASLTGMLDLLKGDGLTFTHSSAPFEYQYKVLRLKHAKAEGNVLGLTAHGIYNRGTDNINISGAIAPAYSLNRLLGKIPVVGNLLASKDGTIFAADYKVSGPVSDADVDINSLSILSPNSMKEWYNKNFGNDDEEQ